MGKRIKSILLVFSGLLMTFCCSCNLLPEAALPEYESGCFRYAVRTENFTEKTGYIVGLTEYGQQQATLVIPLEIDGIHIAGIGYYSRRSLTGVPAGLLYSENLEKLYIPYSYSGMRSDGYFRLSNCYVVKWKNGFFDIGTAGDILGYKYYEKLMQDEFGSWNSNYRTVLLANVSYMYNYDGAEDYGYYWVDSYNNDIIAFPPPDPAREGYSFGGWYKEKECVNVWDFDKDKTGAELEVDYRTYKNEKNDYSPDSPPQYDENSDTKLYAKWIKN